MKSLLPINQKLTRDFRMDMNEVTDEGIIEGYASVFGVTDSYGTAFAPGAFKRSLQNWMDSKRAIPVLWQHNAFDPIGVTMEATEDDRGLKVRAQLVMEVDRAREALALTKAGAISGLSIGFSIPKKASDGMPATAFDEERNVEIIREAKLFEYSMVTFPSNPDARIENARQLQDALTEIRAASDTLTTGYQDALALAREMRGLLDQITVRSARAVPTVDDYAVELIREAKKLLAAQ
jgi:HK97 family phage prohead protease